MIELKHTTTEEDIVKKDAQLLLESPDDAEAHRIMNLISPSNVKADLLSRAADIKVREDFESALLNKYKDTKLVRESDVIKECIKFNMYFGRAQQFRGELSFSLVKKITSFLKENDLLVSEDQYRTNIYMLGYMEFESKHSSDYATFKKNQKDPLIFFQVQEKGETFYILIDGNTSYKNILNRFKGYFFYNQHNSRMVLAAGVMFLILLFTAIPQLGSFHFSWLKWLLIAPAYGIAALLNNILYMYDEYSKQVYSASNQSFFQRNFNIVNKNNGKETWFVGTLMVVILIAFNSILINLKLVHEGSYTATDSKEVRMTEKQIKDNKLEFDPNKEYYSNTAFNTIYTPGILFYNKDEKVTDHKFIVKPK